VSEAPCGDPAHLPTLEDAQLRRAPARDALAVFCEAVQPGGRVGTIRRLRGGISSGMHAVNLIGQDGTHLRVVVRRYGAWRLKHDSRVAEREWSTLTALARVGAPTPRPLWPDPTGAVFGCPTIVTTLVPGRGLLAPRNLSAWIGELASALAKIHAAPLAEAELAMLLDQREETARILTPAETPTSLADKRDGPEVWAAMRGAWPQIEPCDPVLVHGDYWPGNTLWKYGRLSGVIDWEQVRRGDPAQDVACCRLDLTMLFGPEAAALFLQTYRDLSKHAIRRLWFWDLRMAAWAIEGLEHWLEGYHDLGRTDISVEVARPRLEQFTADALSGAAADAVRA
jgi:aminoglycoside phosphotransferase (APT) family kinase protein